MPAMKSPVRILAIDGGGVGGIIPLRLLADLTVSHPGLLARADLLAGTSTGGLIALGLAAGKSPAELRRLYLDLAPGIFSWTGRRTWLGRVWAAKHSPAGLRAAVEAVVGGVTLGELPGPPVYVPVTAVGRPDGKHVPAGVFLSTAYRLAGDPGLERYQSSRWACVDAALATAAAPTYFPAHTVPSHDPARPGEWVCWDGGVTANNPALAALSEVYRLDYATRRAAYTEPAGERAGERAGVAQQSLAAALDVRVLSLGTGSRVTDVGAGDWGYFQTVQPLVRTLLDVSVGSAAFLLRQLLGSRAFRLDLPLVADYDIDDPSVMGRLDEEAGAVAAGGLAALAQPDGDPADLTAWLAENWFD